MVTILCLGTLIHQRGAYGKMKQFKGLAKGKDYQGAFELVNTKYDLDDGIQGKYTMSYVDSDKFSGLTGGDPYSTQEVTIATHIFPNPKDWGKYKVR